MDGEPRDAHARLQDAAPVGGLLQGVDMPNAKIASRCLLRSDYGVIMSVQEPIIQLDCIVDLEPIRSQMHLLESISFEDLRYQSVLFFGFTGADRVELFLRHVDCERLRYRRRELRRG